MPLANMPVLQGALHAERRRHRRDRDRGPTQYSAQPLLAGEVDCLLCWETDLPVAMATQGIESVTMLMADFGYALHSQTYIATEDSLANRRDALVGLMRGEVRGWNAYREDTRRRRRPDARDVPRRGASTADAAVAGRAPGAADVLRSDGRQRLSAGWTDETVAANIETLCASRPDGDARPVGPLHPRRGSMAPESEWPARRDLRRARQDMAGRRQGRPAPDRPELCRRADHRAGGRVRLRTSPTLLAH